MLTPKKHAAKPNKSKDTDLTSKLDMLFLYFYEFF
jgi:hypothetical protein